MARAASRTVVPAGNGEVLPSMVTVMACDDVVVFMIVRF
jgi:hypothetical protein